MKYVLINCPHERAQGMPHHRAEYCPSCVNEMAALIQEQRGEIERLKAPARAYSEKRELVTSLAGEIENPSRELVRKLVASWEPIILHVSTLEAQLAGAVEALRLCDTGYWGKETTPATLINVLDGVTDTVRKALSTPTLSKAAAIRKAELGVIEAAKGALWIDECRCDEAFTARGKHEPNVLCGELEPMRKALSALNIAKAGE